MAADGSYFTAYNLARAAIPRGRIAPKMASSAASCPDSTDAGDVSGDGLTGQPVAVAACPLASSEVSPLANPKLAPSSRHDAGRDRPPNAETVHHKLCSAMTPGIGLAIADKAILYCVGSCDPLEL
jgi:hypothetical protein